MHPYLNAASTFEKQTDTFQSSLTMAPTEDPHLLFPKRLRKYTGRFLAKASGDMGSAETMGPTMPGQVFPEKRCSMAVMLPRFFSAPIVSEQTVKLRNKLIKNNLESRA